MFGWRRRRPWWIIVLAVWLITTGVLLITDYTFPHSKDVLAILAIAAGVLLLLDR